MARGLRLYPPRGVKNPYFIVRGSHWNVKGVYASTGTADERAAKKYLKWVQDQIESGAFQPSKPSTFAGAVISYRQSGGDGRFLARIVRLIGDMPLSEITQAKVDSAATMLYPDATPATRNRQVYTPISAVLRHAGIVAGIRRPKGAQGERRTAYLSEDEAFRFLDAAESLNDRFGALCVFYLYTGCRLSEALRLTWADVDLSRSYAFVGRTKNGEPRPVFLPEAVVASLANLNVEKEVMPPAHHQPQRPEARPPSATGAGAASLANLNAGGALHGLGSGGARATESNGPSASVLANLNAGAAVNSLSSERWPARAGEGDPSVMPDCRRPGARVFRFAKAGRLYDLFREAAAKAGVVVPPRVAFHLFRHSFGAWMRRYAGLDTSGLVATGAWKSPDAARVYEHVETSVEAQKASMLPVRARK